ncbi:hypothetical protein [Cellulomonas sp. NS3]|nr:hypothetical protein [Cellulomonas sp. NS3]
MLDSPVTAGAVSLRDAAELWAADQTSLLAETERVSLRSSRSAAIAE